QNIAGLKDTRIVTLSSVYVTEPQGLTEQPSFYNMVVEVETGLTPHDLLKHLLAIERILGRVRTVRYGPRTIDLDILLYGDRVVSDEHLIVPHPRMVERSFVLVPLIEIFPEAYDPRTGQPLKAYLNRLQGQGIERAHESVQQMIKGSIGTSVKADEASSANGSRFDISDKDKP
ncbi:MAG: 2-amino-4-hydroxy-6-hydroxymethyldihydropteridine diphosphokinase, partial [Candidatus Carbobacillus sp.]|nr:2-amino-4-hydroxy-6-hydroxymethyldihydropteridine diphosphokinase [Candidatus Carbobacillus sp.]